MRELSRVIDSVCLCDVTTGPNAVSRLQFGMVRQPWFIGAVIGTVGGALWFALCVFSLWLCRRRQRRRKHARSNGVVSGKHLLYRCLFMITAAAAAAACPTWGRGTPFLHFPLHFPFTSSSFALFYFFPFSSFHLLYLFFSFVHPFPFYQNSHHSIFRPRVIGGDRTWV